MTILNRNSKLSIKFELVTIKIFKLQQLVDVHKNI